MLDFRRCNSQQLSETYEAFALLCVRGDVRVVLLRAGDEDADCHRTLLDVVETVVRIVGIPLDVRLAVLSGSAPIAAVCEDMRRELRVLGCESRTFRAERSARHWLRGTDEPAAQRRPGQVTAHA